MSANIHPGFETDNWCRTTRGDTAKNSFSWTIEGFKNRPEKFTECIESACFKVIGPSDKTTKWNLEVYPKGDMTENVVSLYLVSQNDFDVRAEFTVWIVNSRKEKSQMNKGDVDEFRSKYESWGWNDIEWNLDDDDNLPDGNLTIFCEVTVYGPEKILSGSKFPEETRYRRDNSRRQVCEDFGTLLKNKKFSDFKIQCGGKSFDCHKNVLSARSPVFEAMLQHDMRENTTNKVTMNDVSPDVVAEMLHYIYTGSVSNGFITAKVAFDLLGTADKYKLDILKNTCEDKLCSSLEIDNSIQNLVLGDLHKAVKLRKMAMKLVVKNMDLIVDSDVYKNLMIKHTDLAHEITKALVQKAGTKRKLDERE